MRTVAGSTGPRPLKAFRYQVALRGAPVPTSKVEFVWSHEHGYELRLHAAIMEGSPAITDLAQLQRTPDPSGETVELACLNEHGATVRTYTLIGMRAQLYGMQFNSEEDAVLMETIFLRGGIITSEVLGEVEP